MDCGDESQTAFGELTVYSILNSGEDDSLCGIVLGLDPLKGTSVAIQVIATGSYLDTIRACDQGSIFTYDKGCRPPWRLSFA